MAVSQDLMLAILSMDSYNRGYGQGLDVVAAGASSTQIGTASIGTSSNPNAGSAEVNAGFYAQEYTWNGKTIISYRGTDNIDFTGSAPGASDVWNGWVNAVGIPTSGLGLAQQFYNAVTNSTYQAGPAANTILTGHSLGGGLAGYMAWHYRGRFPFIEPNALAA